MDKTGPWQHGRTIYKTEQQNNLPVELLVKSPGFHPGARSSILRRETKQWLGPSV